MTVAEHYLHPSTLFASQAPHHVHTVLGSCVSVCLWDRTLQLGGINHYMLPLWNGNGLATPRYGNIAIKKLIEALEGHGCNRQRMEAKVFGGAKVLGSSTPRDSLSIGDRNIETAEFILNEYSIPVVSRCVGGDCGYKLIYKTYTGEVLLKRIRSVDVQERDRT